MAFVKFSMNAAKICDGLTAGRTLSAALCDIIDNAVDAGAKRISVILTPKPPFGKRRTMVKSYLIIDDGQGMDENGIINALTLGSSEANYTPNTLSKFGLGLKSASFSQGETLELLSSNGSGVWHKYRVSLPEIRAREEYGAERVELSDDDDELIAEHLPLGHGTIVRVTDIRKGNHPSIRQTTGELQQRVGIIYYYPIQEDGLTIVVDGRKCASFDVLFTEEANKNGNLDENAWNGREVSWLEKPSELVLDGERGVKATVEITQLPHPPTFESDGPGEQSRVRDQVYRIASGNYGYYVYRNKRLIAWADRFMGVNGYIIPQDQDFLSFRGRLLIDSSADDALNIDVKKSQLQLSEEAYKALDDFTADAKRKSKKAWKHAGAEIKRRAGMNPGTTANQLAEQVQIPDELPGEPDTEEAFQEKQEREREIIEEQEQRFEAEAAQLPEVQELALDLTQDEIPPEIMQKVIAGEQAGAHDRIMAVRNFEDNSLWEPYYDTDKKNCVRVNSVHRFAKIIYQDNTTNAALRIVFDLMLLQLAAAENHVQKTMNEYKRKDIEAILQEYRRVASEMLAKVAKDVGDKITNAD